MMISLSLGLMHRLDKGRKNQYIAHVSYLINNEILCDGINVSSRACISAQLLLVLTQNVGVPGIDDRYHRDTEEFTTSGAQLGVRS